MSADRITRDDLEDKLRELEGGARDQVASARSTAVTAGVVALVLLLLLAFLLGRRKGKHRSTVVEIRRV
jgi:trans-2-enoyl-CoA reductase